ncbi:hypothetical protein HYW18_01415 [Candidatus Uhrbacteria bacterium]|nr:hypothetical protein [Candidatus Uhrbacteria bacterium]
MSDRPLSKEAVCLVSFCPVCERRDVSLRGRVLESDGDTQLLYVHCDYGKHAILMLLMTNGEMVSSVGVVTDLSVHDLGRKTLSLALDEDELLEAYQFFQNPAALSARLVRSA